MNEVAGVKPDYAKIFVAAAKDEMRRRENRAAATGLVAGMLLMFVLLKFLEG